MRMSRILFQHSQRYRMHVVVTKHRRTETAVSRFSNYKSKIKNIYILIRLSCVFSCEFIFLDRLLHRIAYIAIRSGKRNNNAKKSI